MRDSVRQQAPLTQPTTSTKSGPAKGPPREPFTSSPVPRPHQSLPMTSSPPASLASKDEQREQKPRITAGRGPDRAKLAEMIGVNYSDKSRKIFLRKRVKEWVLKHVDMTKPFSKHSDTEMVAIPKRCTRYMNREFILQGQEWSREATYHLIHTIFTDTRRNENTKKKTELAKQKAELGLQVSQKASLSSKLCFC